MRSLEPLLEQALPQDRYVDNVAVTPTAPQEDSIPLATMGAASYYHGMYFPKHFETHFRRDVFGAESQADIERWKHLHRHLLQKVSVHQGHRPLLIKNPVYAGYIRHLRALWPGAKFIHIYRNPYRVFVSARHYFTRLLPELALQDYGDLPIDSLVLESYPFLLDALKTDTADLPVNQFVELSFEALQSDPLAELKPLFEQLDLPGFEAASSYFEAYLADLKDYQQNQYSLDAETVSAVENHWQPYIQRWDYSLDTA